ncbi:HpcH/HpaI aldolase/citrate lyase family protein [Acuticoccus kandeliae]|uniref:HpcH/HpaI aldolase/citrate lyase family protein n=1 Tax=Acuticoccus kandeliae TaxID=2073160 RepID=UPI000D3E8778|nr:CoA ester lyase [Acuticoccus kandeliae]
MPRDPSRSIAARWRALLYVPAHKARFVEKAPSSGADAVILDLEDSVPAGAKAEARAALGPATASLHAAGLDVLVRINRPLELAVDDVRAAVAAGADAITVAKADGPSHVRLLAELLDTLERDVSRSAPMAMVVLIETLDAFWDMKAIAAASDRVVAMTLGGEDIAAAVHGASDEETLLWPRQQMIFAAATAGVAPIGLMGSLAGYKDKERFRAIAERSRRFGYWGATCIHPDQVAIVREAFSPSEDEVANAQKIVTALDEAIAAGDAAVSVDGRMIDPPVAAHARRILEIDARIKARAARTPEPVAT